MRRKTAQGRAMRRLKKAKATASTIRGTEGIPLRRARRAPEIEGDPAGSDGVFSFPAPSSGANRGETDMTTHQRIAGLWLPLITPFNDGQLDEPSLTRLVRHYAAEPVDGLILAATTGEGLMLDETETERLVAITAGTRDRALPIFLGVSSADTRKVAAALARSASWPIEGYLIPCPYYV